MHKLVDQFGRGANRLYLVDFIRIHFKVSTLNSAEVRFLYLEKGWSAAQLAEHYGVSKTAIIGRLRKMKISEGTGKNRMTRPDNYRLQIAPYGYRLVNGKLQLSKRELKICRLVVHLIGHEHYGIRETARELEVRGFKNKSGKVKWSHFVVQRIWNRWKAKV